ncbi:hypothetical protein Tco_0586020 [Tanacetum coccineum]
MPTLPPSLLISLSPPSARERLARCTTPSAHSSPPPVPSPLLPSYGCPTQIQTLRIANSGPVDCSSKHEVGESSTARPTGGQGINYRFVSTVDAEARRRGIREVGYGIRDTWVDLAEAVPEIAPMIMGEDSRTRISQRVTMDSQRVDLPMEDRIAHQETILIVEEEAYASREAWANAIRLSQAVHYELQTHREQVHETRSQMQQAEMVELRETDCRRQVQMVETLHVMRDMRREMGDMQAELLALREQQKRAGQPGQC